MMHTTSNGNATCEALEAALDYGPNHGLRVVPCPRDPEHPKREKHPRFDKWQHLASADPDTIVKLWEEHPEENVFGVLGKESNTIDFEIDSPVQAKLFAEIFEGYETLCPTFRTPRGPHHLFQYDDRLDETGAAVIRFGEKGDELIVRIGACGKGAGSVFPPSVVKGVQRYWLPGCSLDDIDIPSLPDVVVKELVKRWRKSHPNCNGDSCNVVPKNNGPNGKANERNVKKCIEAMLKIKRPDVENDGSYRLHTYACRCVGHGLDDEQAIDAVHETGEFVPLNSAWTDTFIKKRLRQAERKVERGYEAVGDDETEERDPKGRVDVSPRRARRPLTDYGNAERFADQHGGNVRYCHVWKKWLVWDGGRWALDDTGAAERLAKQTVRSIYSEASNETNDDRRKAINGHAVASERKERIAAMLTLSRSEQPVPVRVKQLDAEPWFLNCENGTIDLRTGELREHRRDDYLTKMAPVEYPTEPGVDAVLWQTFLDRIFDGNGELIEFVQRLVGMALVGKVRDHVLPIFFGTGSNGKSVFIETICGMLGSDYSMKAPQGLLMAAKQERHATERADLFGKRFVAAVETEDGCRLAESLVKELTGGDSIRARRLYEDHWQFTPSHSVVLVTNHKPIIRGTDHGIWRRILLVPFTVTIPEKEQDRDLKAKMEREWPAILRWAVEGCLTWHLDGLTPPGEVITATAEYHDDMDLLGEFIVERCLIGPSYQAKGAQLYTCYRDWADERGESKLSQTRFGSQLRERGFTKRTSNGVWYDGIGVREV